jgi:dipeptidase
MWRSSWRKRLRLPVILAAVTLVVPAGSVSAAYSDPGREETSADHGLPAQKNPAKSIGFYVGKNLTDDGSVLLGGFGQEPSSHWLEIVPRRDFPEGATTTVGVTEDASYAGKLTEIPQVSHTNKYITSNYSEFAGFPAPLTNGGLNEHGVAARDIWSPTSERLLALTEEPQTGPNYSDLSRIAMERATTAREAVEIVGGLIDKYGYSTYGGNSHLFADKNEGWILVNYGGSQGLWAAERLGPDEVRVSFPGYLNPFPVDYKQHPDEYLASDNFIGFATQQGWFDPARSDVFDPQAVYAGWQPNDRDVTPTHPWGTNVQGELEQELREQYAPVSLQDLMAYVRDPRWSHDRAGYGQVASLHDVAHPGLNALWTAVTGAVTTPYVPIYIGAEDVPPEYKQHRYLTSDTASTHIAADYAPLEATRYATRTFKRLMYHTCEHPETFLKPVTAEIERFERDMLHEHRRISNRALMYFRSGREDKAHDFLTEYVGGRLLDALTLGEDLVDEVEAQTREQFGIRMPAGRDEPGETYRPESQSMNRGGDLEAPQGNIVTCYREGIDDYPREHGSYQKLAGDLLTAGAHGTKRGAAGLSKQEFMAALKAAGNLHGHGRDWHAFAETAWQEAQKTMETGER